MNLLPAAVEAVSRGWHIFPLPPQEKFDRRLRWSKMATNDMRKVVHWWTIRPGSNIGIACKPSGLLVIDCDVPKEGGECEGTPYAQLHQVYGPLVDGHDVLRAVCRRYGGDWASLVDTYAVTTTRMGLHLYYSWPAGVLASQASIVRGLLDVRTNGGTKGGYVLGAGSRTDSGPYVVENDAPVAPAPPWLVELIRDKPRPQGPRVEYAGPKNWSGLAETVASAPEGNRNNSLLWAARAMVSDGASEADIDSVLIPPATANGLSEKETRDTIRSAIRLQQRKDG